MSLFTNLGNAIRLSRSASYAPSGLVDEPRNQTNSTSESKRNQKITRYLIVIKILSGLLAIMMAFYIREFVNKKYINTTIEQSLITMNNAKKLQKLESFKHLGFLWDLCNRTTLQCSHCLPGWTEHASRCFFLFNVERNWENARRECLHYKGDLAVVENAEDQAFLTKMTFQVKKASSSDTYHSVWIGLQDLVKEGSFSWVNGETIKWNVKYWRPGEPNNNIGPNDTDPEKDGQDCVSILPPDQVGSEGWMNSWNDNFCFEKHCYICETDALILA